MEYDRTENKNILQPKFCMYCGKEMGDSVKFCPYCGKTIKSSPNRVKVFLDIHFNVICISLLAMIICTCLSVFFIVFWRNIHRAVQSDSNDMIMQNRNIIEENEKLVTGEIVEEAVLDGIEHTNDEEQINADEKENIIISGGIMETKPYVMQGACHPMCFIIQPYLSDDVTERSATPALIYLSCYSIENQQANVVYMNGYTLQYDSFTQKYYRLNNIMGNDGIFQLLSIINDNYLLNLNDFVIVNFTLFGKYADMIGGVKLDIGWDEAEFKQIQDLYEDWGREDEIFMLLEKLKNDEKFFYDDFEILSVICNLSTSITEEMRAKLGRELFDLLLQIIESDEYGMLYENFLAYCPEDLLSENAMAIKGDYVWNQSRSIGQWYLNGHVGQCFIQEDYIDYVKNVGYLLYGEVNYAVVEEIQTVNEKLEEAKEQFEKLE